MLLDHGALQTCIIRQLAQACQRQQLISALQINLFGEWSIWRSLDWGYTEQVAGSAVEHWGKHPNRSPLVSSALAKHGPLSDQNSTGYRAGPSC